MTHLFSATFSQGRLYDPIDGFQLLVVGGGTIELSGAAAVAGSYGCAITPRNRYRTVGARRVNNLARLRQAFDFDPNSITIPTTKSIYVCRNYHLDATQMIYVLSLNYTAPNYQLQIASYHDDGETSYSAAVVITDAPHVIELDWAAATAPGANDGFMRLYVDGVLATSLTGQDNDTLRVNWPSLGIGTPPNSTISGCFYVTNWVANDDGAELTHPWIASVSIGTVNKHTISMALSEVVTSDNFALGMSFLINAAPVNILSATLQGDGITVRYVLDDGAILTDTVTMAYNAAAGNITDAAGNPLPNIPNMTVTNNVLPPAVVGIEVGMVDRTTLPVRYTKEAFSADFTAGASVTVNGSAASIISAAKQSDGATVNFVINTVVKPRMIVLWSYDAGTGDVVDADGGIMVDVTNYAVTNNTRLQYLAWVDFEDNNLLEFTSVQDPDNDLSVQAGAALAGTNFGGKFTIDDNTEFFGIINWTNSASGYLGARFYLKPNSITMTNGELVYLLNVYNAAAQTMCQITLNRNIGEYKLSARAYLDDDSSVDTALHTINNAPHCIEIALAAGAGNGSLALMIDGATVQTLSGLVNGTRSAISGYGLLGCISVSSGTRGDIYMDELVIHNRNEVIGA